MMRQGGGRGRGISNKPAWMTKMEREKGPSAAPPAAPTPAPAPAPAPVAVQQQQPQQPQQQHRARSRSRSRDRDRSRGGGRSSSSSSHPAHSRGGRNSSSRHGGRSQQPPPQQRHTKRFINEPGSLPARHVNRRNATREEWEWNEDRRQNRQRQRRDPKYHKFDVQPTPEELMVEQQAKAALALKAAGTVNPSFVPPSQLERREQQQQYSQVNQQTRHARRLYIGNVPEFVEEAEVKQFFCDCIARATSSPQQQQQQQQEDPILSVYINRERRFSFVEFRTIEMCTSCLQLDGINLCQKGIVKIKRPNDFNPQLLTPDPHGMAGFDASQLGIVSTAVPDGPHKIFIGGLPYHLSDAQVLELLQAFGRVKAFHLVRDAGSPTSKGYGFVEYSDGAAVTDVAVMGLEGMDLGGGKTLSARKAEARNDPTGGAAGAGMYGQMQMNGQMQMQMNGQMQMSGMYGPGMVPGGGGAAIAGAGGNVVGGVDIDALLNAAMGGAAPPPPPIMAAMSAPIPQQQPSMGSMQMPMNTNTNGGGLNAMDIANAASNALEAAFGGMPAAAPSAAAAQPAASYQQQQQQQQTNILVLHHMVMDQDLAADEDYADLYDEVKGECEKFGRLLSMKIPRPQDRYKPSSVKKIFLEYVSSSDAAQAERELGGRAFGPNIVQCTYFDEAMYKNGDLS